MQIAIDHHPTNSLVADIFRKLPHKERRRVETEIAAVTDTDLPTAIRPFMFGGKVVHELYFDPAKLVFFIGGEKSGAVVSAFIISILAHDAGAPLSDQSLRTHPRLIIRYAKRLKYGPEVSTFLRRFEACESEWRRDSFPDLPDESDLS
jgi:hypothetical protein